MHPPISTWKRPGKLQPVPDDVTQRVVQGSACIKFLEELGSVDFVLCYLESKGLWIDRFLFGGGWRNSNKGEQM